jgi:colicin import membrane protein
VTTVTATQEVRFRPLGRGTFMGGFFVTLAIHAVLFGLVWYGTVKAPPREEKEREIILTEMVKLGKPREKFWLPRIVEAPPPPPVEKVIPLAQDPNAKPVEKKPEKPPEKPPEKQDLSKKVQDVLNRRRAMLQNASEPEEGLATGSIHGTANTQTEGDPYASMIRDMIREHWNVPSGLTLGEVLNLETRIRIQLAEDGTLLDPKITKSSGNQLYDDTCVQAIQATRKVPPPPADKRATYRRGIVFPFGGKDLAR